MKKQIIITAIFITFSTNYVFSQQLSHQAKDLAKKALSCIYDKDYYCGMENLENLLKNYGQELNSKQAKAIKNELVVCYFELAMAKAKNDNPNYKSYCLKGIKLEKEMGNENSFEH